MKPNKFFLIYLNRCVTFYTLATSNETKQIFYDTLERYKQDLL